MEYIYKPKGVCSQEFVFDIEDDVVKKLTVNGGCKGNLQGISKLCEGMKVQDIIDKISGIKCGVKATSCPDQIAIGLKAFLENEVK